jgi:hypothetical protein
MSFRRTLMNYEVLELIEQYLTLDFLIKRLQAQITRIAPSKSSNNGEERREEEVL